MSLPETQNLHTADTCQASTDAGLESVGGRTAVKIILRAKMPPSCGRRSHEFTINIQQHVFPDYEEKGGGEIGAVLIA